MLKTITIKMEDRGSAELLYTEVEYWLGGEDPDALLNRINNDIFIKTRFSQDIVDGLIEEGILDPHNHDYEVE